MLNLNAFLVGLLFGLGLIISGMANPAKVIGFLDLAGAWDPSLAFVMGGAILIGSGGFAIAKKLRRSLLGAPMHLPTATKLDKGLLIGSLIFGIGWGLAGFCPGPAVVSAATGQPKAWVFVVSMLAGMALYVVLARRGRSD
jgi:hypothetical protein